MGLFLTNNELQELTGYKLASKQSSWLSNKGYYVETNARGIPRITYIQIEERRRLLASTNNVIALNQPDKPTFETEPNFKSLRNKIKKVSANGQI